MSGINLSERHGVNPSILKCPVCGKKIGVALLGKLKGDQEAPRYVRDQRPCKECREAMSKGVLLVEVVEKAGERHTTGRQWVVTPECVRRIFTRPAGFAEQVIKAGACHIEEETAELVGLHSQEGGDHEEGTKR